jgi:hypothetical protein
MSFFVELTIEDKTYSVRRYYVTITRDKDEKGRPASDPTWRLHLILDRISDNTISNLMLDPKKLVSGKLTLYKLDGSKLKEIEFKKSTCTEMYDYYNINHSFISSRILIRGRDMKINSAEITQKWAGSK